MDDLRLLQLACDWLDRHPSLATTPRIARYAARLASQSGATLACITHVQKPSFLAAVLSHLPGFQGALREVGIDKVVVLWDARVWEEEGAAEASVSGKYLRVLLRHRLSEARLVVFGTNQNAVTPSVVKALALAVSSVGDSAEGVVVAGAFESEVVAYEAVMTKLGLLDCMKAADGGDESGSESEREETDRGDRKRWVNKVFVSEELEDAAAVMLEQCERLRNAPVVVIAAGDENVGAAELFVEEVEVEEEEEEEQGEDQAEVVEGGGLEVGGEAAALEDIMSEAVTAMRKAKALLHRGSELEKVMHVEAMEEAEKGALEEHGSVAEGGVDLAKEGYEDTSQEEMVEESEEGKADAYLETDEERASMLDTEQKQSELLLESVGSGDSSLDDVTEEEEKSESAESYEDPVLEDVASPTGPVQSGTIESLRHISGSAGLSDERPEVEAKESLAAEDSSPEEKQSRPWQSDFDEDKSLPVSSSLRSSSDDEPSESKETENLVSTSSSLEDSSESVDSTFLHISKGEMAQTVNDSIPSDQSPGNRLSVAAEDGVERMRATSEDRNHPDIYLNTSTSAQLQGEESEGHRVADASESETNRSQLSAVYHSDDAGVKKEAIEQFLSEMKAATSANDQSNTEGQDELHFSFAKVLTRIRRQREKLKQTRMKDILSKVDLSSAKSAQNQPEEAQDEANETKSELDDRSERIERVNKLIQEMDSFCATLPSAPVFSEQSSEEVESLLSFMVESVVQRLESKEDEAERSSKAGEDSIEEDGSIGKCETELAEEVLEYSRESPGVLVIKTTSTLVLSSGTSVISEGEHLEALAKDVDAEEVELLASEAAGVSADIHGEETRSKSSNALGEESLGPVEAGDLEDLPLQNTTASSQTSTNILLEEAYISEDLHYQASNEESAEEHLSEHEEDRDVPIAKELVSAQEPTPCSDEEPDKEDLQVEGEQPSQSSSPINAMKFSPEESKSAKLQIPQSALHRSRDSSTASAHAHIPPEQTVPAPAISRVQSSSETLSKPSTRLAVHPSEDDYLALILARLGGDGGVDEQHKNVQQVLAHVNGFNTAFTSNHRICHRVVSSGAVGALSTLLQRPAARKRSSLVLDAFQLYEHLLQARPQVLQREELASIRMVVPQAMQEHVYDPRVQESGSRVLAALLDSSSLDSAQRGLSVVPAEIVYGLVRTFTEHHRDNRVLGAASMLLERVAAASPQSAELLGEPNVVKTLIQ